MVDPTLPSSIYPFGWIVMTTERDSPCWIKHLLPMRIFFFSSLDDRAGWHFFLLAVVLYHCATQVHWRSMTQTQHCSNIFHLGANEMHFTVNPQSEGQATTAPAIYLTAKFKLPFLEIARAQPHNGYTSSKPGSNLPKVLPRKSPVIETVPLSPLFHTVSVHYFVFYVPAHPETMTDFVFFALSLLFYPLSMVSLLLLPPLPLSSLSFLHLPYLSPIRSPVDHLQQPGVHQNWWRWREGAPLPGPDLRPVL